VPHVPFENLDIHYHRPIKVTLHDLYWKIEIRERGGFCYELNGLLGALLQELGFQVKMISARAGCIKKDGGYSPEFDHMSLLVNVEHDTYLVDIGFGSFSLEPLLLRKHTTLHDPHGDFLFNDYDEDHFRVSILENGQKIPQYIFSCIARDLGDFTDGCHYHQYNPGSHFKQKKVVSLPREYGRITPNDEQIKIRKGDQNREVKFNPGLFEDKLWEVFGFGM